MLKSLLPIQELDMKVMFVDDEQMILNGIKRAFFKSNWDLAFATGGEQALDKLKEFPADFIVSDMRMPGMNGADFLEKTSKLYPSAVRIVLSGHADLDLSIQASYVAHQWYNKPCEPDTLKEEFERIYSVRSELPYDEIQTLLAGVNSLPSIPRRFIKIKSMLLDDSVGMKDISLLISEDSSLTAKVLQVANSSFFVTSTKVVKIDDAIIRLGVDVVCNIVAVAEIYSNIDSNWEGYFEEILQRALKTARLASLIVDKPNREITMLAGLLHNIGELLFCQINTNAMDTYIQKRVIGGDNLALEIETFKVDSIQITSYLLHLWHFPYSIIECIFLQSRVDKLVDMELGSAAAIYLSRMIINNLEISPEIIQQFDISEQLDDWRNWEDK